MSIHLSTLLKHYKRPEIQKEILYNSPNREVAVKYGEKGFGKRPDTLQYANDVLEFAKQKATSFHISEEIWHNPVQLSTEMSKKDQEELRKGWDLVLDIDSMHFEISRIVAHLVIEVIKHYKIKAVSCKFSGNKGFHIAVPFESFPKEVNGLSISSLFPEAARKVAAHIWSVIQKRLEEEIIKKYSIEKLQHMSGKSFSEITKNVDGNVRINPKAFVDIDTVLISSRHLYRSSYSFNEKSGLVSIPLNPDKVLEFNKITASPKNVRISRFRFLDREKAVRGEAKALLEASLSAAFDESEDVKKKYDESRRNYISMKRQFESEDIAEAIPEQYFPPCINLILSGLKDGRKRSLFILVNFLTSVGWEYDKIEELIAKWNKKNHNPLKEGIIKSHIRYHKQNKKKVLPPNCENIGYYKDFGVCKPDTLCRKIKNPAQYTKVKARNIKRKKD